MVKHQLVKIAVVRIFVCIHVCVSLTIIGMMWHDADLLRLVKVLHPLYSRYSRYHYTLWPWN